MSIIFRIKQIADKENVKITNLEKKIEASKGVLSRALNNGTDIQSKWITKIVENYPQYNPVWLLTGNGQMLSSKSNDFPSKKSGIPLIPTNAIAGLSSGSISIKENDIQQYYNVPDFTNVDFMIRVKGSSMYPKYNSGDVVACRLINDSKFLQWNKVHIVATKDQGVLIKRLKQSNDDDCLLAVSDNQSYDPFNIPKEEILNIALVIGVIRVE